MGESLTAYYTFKDNFEKCKYKDEDVFLIPFFKLGLMSGLICVLVIQVIIIFNKILINIFNININ